MKKIILIILLAMTLTSCSYVKVDKYEEQKEDSTSMFVTIETTGIWTIVYNKETKVMYAVSYSAHNCGVFTLLVNSDGTPMIWED